MPDAAHILDGLAMASRQGRVLAIAWHAIMLAVLAALVLGWRPDRRLAGVILIAPLVSVSAMAWLVGNPFNGAVFAALSLALLILALRLPARPVAAGESWAVVVGVLMVAFGWGYPHFLDSGTPWAYIYAAPFGLIPCPTLSGVIGFALLGGGLGGRAWSVVLAGAGVFYALVGTLRLGVHIDLFLLAGAIALVVVAFRGNPATGE